jgi:hypothetical protein
MKKPRGRKSRDTVPLIRMNNVTIAKNLGSLGLDTVLQNSTVHYAQVRKSIFEFFGFSISNEYSNGNSSLLRYSSLVLILYFSDLASNRPIIKPKC